MRISEMGEWDLVQLYQATKLNGAINDIDWLSATIDKDKGLIYQMFRDVCEDIRKARNQI